MEIQNSYLMWIGTEHYGTIEDWAEETIARGVSKRVPGLAVGSKLMESGTVIFVAHDEGESEDCEDCAGEIDCPECRKREQEMERLQAEIDSFKKHFDSDADFDSFASGSQKRSVKVRSERIEKLMSAVVSCALCQGSGTLKAGTGGHVTMANGDKMDYRTYNYWLHQPKKFNMEGVKEKAMCLTCGGTGKLPCSKIFGMFVPERLEYIVAGGESADKLAEIKKAAELVDGKVVAKEKPRGCGKRKPGGVYAVSSTEADPAKATAALKELVEKGVIDPEATEIHGSFVRFLSPIEVEVKRFRGVKSFSLTAEAEDAAQDVLDAMVASS